jgi:hypothetical protein
LPLYLKLRIKWKKTLGTVISAFVWLLPTSKELDYLREALPFHVARDKDFNIFK